jgi:hypothetical protein
MWILDLSIQLNDFAQRICLYRSGIFGPVREIVADYNGVLLRP